MNHQLSKLQKTIIWTILIILPIAYYWVSFDPITGFSRLIYFGSDFSANALPALKETPHLVVDGPGYDGQFYAQLSLDPILRSHEIKLALDNPTYRARRILLPVFAYLAGFGLTSLIINTYAIINFIFYMMLIAGLIKFVHPNTFKDFLCIIPLCWGTGSIISLARALTDLPATVLIFYAIWAQNNLFFSLACLCRETSLVNLIGSLDRHIPFKQNLLKVIRIVFPLAFWMCYVLFIFGVKGSLGSSNFSFPFWGILRQFGINFNSLLKHPDIRSVSEMLALISFTLQAVYLVIHRNGTPLWRIGISSVILFFFLGTNVMVEDLAYARVILPMTFSFNLLLMEEKDKFIHWFFAGNLGVFGGLARVTPYDCIELHLAKINPLSDDKYIYIQYFNGQ